ncbi:MAG: HDOD domain-containing protein [Methylococcales bacterium]
MNKMFEQIHNVPRIPEVVRTLITQFNDPKIDFSAVAKNVEKEQIITLKILRLVNSAHFGLSKKVGTIQDAVVMLGMNQLRTLVVASGMVAAVPKIENVNMKHFWEDSFRTATYAKWIAAETQNAPDLAFTAGLINGLGTILIYMGAPAEAHEIDQLVKQGSARAEIEMLRLGFTSEEVSAELCRRWHFSEDLIDAVAQCGAPLTNQPPSFPACVVNIARYISAAYRQQLSTEDMLKSFPFAVAEKLGLTEQFIIDKLPEILEIESGLDGLAD